MKSSQTSSRNGLHCLNALSLSTLHEILQLIFSKLELYEYQYENGRKEDIPLQNLIWNDSECCSKFLKTEFCLTILKWFQ